MEHPQEGKRSERLPAKRLAALIVDALVDAGIVDREKLDAAVLVVSEEITARRELGDA